MQSRRCSIAALSLIWLNSATAIGADAVTRVDTYGDWSLLTDTNAPHLFCFVTSEPKTSEPQDAPRDAPRAYISAWPKDGIRGEISFRMGSRIKKNADGTATVKSQRIQSFRSRRPRLREGPDAGVEAARRHAQRQFADGRNCLGERHDRNRYLFSQRRRIGTAEASGTRASDFYVRSFERRWT